MSARASTAPLLLAAVLVGFVCPLDRLPAQIPASQLGVRVDGRWVTWWAAERAPAHWPEPLERIAGAVEWQAVGPGMELGRLSLAGDGLAWRFHVILVRLEASRLDWKLVRPLTDGAGDYLWGIDEAPEDVILAVNAGQFEAARPWGWLVRDGVEEQPPGRGPLSLAVVVDTAASLRLVTPERIAALRGREDLRHAFQSYPALLWNDGRVPPQLRASGRGVDLTHRDGRLAVGQLRDGRLLVVLTRFGMMGERLGWLPFGPTSPEMAAIMGALGCHAAVMLDGGLSAQLLVRDSAGSRHRFPGQRRVPLALVARSRGSPSLRSPSEWR